MSSPEKAEALHNHPNAVKAGGMRIVQNKSHFKDKKTDTPVPPPNDDALKVSTSPPKSAVSEISGAPNHGNADFTKEAVQSFHDKPVPTHDDRGAASKPMIIQQPRK